MGSLELDRFASIVPLYQVIGRDMLRSFRLGCDLLNERA